MVSPGAVAHCQQEAPLWQRFRNPGNGAWGDDLAPAANAVSPRPRAARRARNPAGQPRAADELAGGGEFLLL